jgi:hypothetical protein
MCARALVLQHVSMIYSYIYIYIYIFVHDERREDAQPRGILLARGKEGPDIASMHADHACVSSFVGGWVGAHSGMQKPVDAC